MKIEHEAVFKIYRFPSKKSLLGYETLERLIERKDVKIGDSVVCGFYQLVDGDASVIKGDNEVKSFKQGNRFFTIPKYCLKKA